MTLAIDNKIKIERIYDSPKGDKSFRILVDRLWPRGLSKDKVKVAQILQGTG